MGHRHKGFTLIELLVVISIIALLMGILMPALSRARKQGRDVYCLNNLRQLGVALQMYTEEYDDFIIQDHWLFVIKEAKTVPGSTASQGSEAGGMMVVIRRTGGAEGEEDEGREAKPLEVVGYELGI